MPRPALLAAALLTSSTACFSRPEPPGGAGGSASSASRLDLVPATTDGAAARVARVRVRAAGPASAAGALLVRGTLSSSNLRDVARQSPPATLTARAVDALAWVDPDDPSSVWLAPTAPLAPGETYAAAIAAPAFGATFTVQSSDDAPLLARTWPPARRADASPDFAIWCGELALPDVDCGFAVDPGARGGVARRGVGAPLDVPTCLRWDASSPSADGAPSVPPPALALGEGVTVRLEPATLAGDASAPAPATLACEADEVPLGPGCARADDDRATLRTPSEPLLWAITVDGATRVRTSAGETLVLRELAPDAELDLAVTTVDLAGRTVTSPARLRTAPAHARVVVNEVYANPRGAEPAQEWIELLEDGAVDVDLAGYQLEANGTAAVLPEGSVLGAGAFALVVAQGFVDDDGVDPVAAPGTLVVRVPRLGRSGLSNEGPAIVLRDPSGAIVSRFAPALKPREGVSVGRVRPEAADDDPAAFALDAAGGATPGAPNRSE